MAETDLKLMQTRSSTGEGLTRLPLFIRENVEAILMEWEGFARALPGAETMDIIALRDHAKEMLKIIALDLEQPQSVRQQSKKAKGHSDASEHQAPTPTPAQEHGAGRADSGFTISQMVAEFRALRASVISLWTARERRATAIDLQDMIRFNEAIDQAIAESITTYARDVTESKDRFLAILGHDLRTPLGAILMSATFMLDVGELTEPNLSLVRRIELSCRRMNQMVSDLLEFTRTRFGDDFPIDPREMDLEPALREVASEIRASKGAIDLDLSVHGNLRGSWDSARLTQAVINLVSNAVEHGDASRPVTIDASREEAEVVIKVHNEGAPISPERVPTLFQPMKTAARGGSGDRRHLGLGLYIVDRIAKAHGGRVEVSSSITGGTTFTLRLPADRARQPQGHSARVGS